jgi:hypothetical protein
MSALLDGILPIHAVVTLYSSYPSPLPVPLLSDDIDAQIAALVCGLDCFQGRGKDR